MNHLHNTPSEYTEIPYSPFSSAYEHVELNDKQQVVDKGWDHNKGPDRDLIVPM